MSPSELIERFKAGDSQALNQLYIDYKPRLLGICRQFTKEDSVAEDLLHDAFVVIITSLDKLKDISKLDSWMTSIVHNVGCQYQKHLAKEQAAIQQMASESSVLDSAQEQAASPIDSLSPDYDLLQSLVTQLPQGYQQVFRLSVFEGLSHQEIGQLLGIAPHSSSSQLSHAKRMLRLLIKQSWVLILLLVAVPAAIWHLLRKPAPKPEKPIAHSTTPEPKPAPVVETPQDKLAYASAHPKPRHRPLHYQTESVIQPDSIPHYNDIEQSDTQKTVVQEVDESDSIEEMPIIRLQPLHTPEHHYTASTKSEPSVWDIRLTYIGQLGHGDDYLAASKIGNGTFMALSNSHIIENHSFDNWVDYNYYLSYSPLVKHDAETRSLMNIAAQNTMTNNLKMETRHEHQLPQTVELLLSRQISRRLYVETGLSYTRLISTSTTGSTHAYVQEKQRLSYIGIPLHLSYQWYRRSHLSLYTSAGTMMEIPIRGATDINHIANGFNTFSNDIRLSVPLQWSASLGLGLQYDFAPHIGLFAEPSLQYFFNDGSDLKSYRTEHPFQITLPIGIRVHW